MRRTGSHVSEDRSGVGRLTNRNCFSRFRAMLGEVGTRECQSARLQRVSHRTDHRRALRNLITGRKRRGLGRSSHDRRQCAKPADMLSDKHAKAMSRSAACLLIANQFSRSVAFIVDFCGGSQLSPSIALPILVGDELRSSNRAVYLAHLLSLRLFLSVG